ncbi:MAG: hypothetical protein V8R49_11240 [Duodenibacillus massiliensis]
MIVRSAGFSFSAGSVGPLRLSTSGRDVIIPLPAAVLLNLFRFETALFKATKEHCFLGTFSLRAYFYWLFGASHAYFYALFSVLHGFFYKTRSHLTHLICPSPKFGPASAFSLKTERCKINVLSGVFRIFMQFLYF